MEKCDDERSEAVGEFVVRCSDIVDSRWSELVAGCIFKVFTAKCKFSKCLHPHVKAGFLNIVLTLSWLSPRTRR